MGTTVLGFSFTGSSVPAGCGTLTNLTLSGESTGFSSVVFSDPFGQAYDVSYFEGGDEVCDCDGNIDEDGDGICDGEDDCIGEYDECGVCKGDGIEDGA